MKQTALLIGTAVLATALAASVAMAQRPDGPRGAMMDFKTLDADGNGEITQSEMNNMRAARFATLDSDGDGLLSQEELRASGRARADARVEQMMERHDANGDGALSLEELPQKGKGRRAGKMFDRMDADGSGTISKQEFDTARSRWMQRHGAQPDQN